VCVSSVTIWVSSVAQWVLDKRDVGGRGSFFLFVQVEPPPISASLCIIANARVCARLHVCVLGVRVREREEGVILRIYSLCVVTELVRHKTSFLPNE